MKTKILCFIFCVLVAVVGISFKASAITMEAKYTGTISAGVDTFGLFGPVGSDLIGQSFTAIYLFDFNQSDIVASSNIQFDTVVIQGSNFGMASITVNGNSFSLSGTDLGILFASHNVNTSQSGQEAFVRQTPDILIWNEIFNFPGVLPLSVTTPFAVNGVGSNFVAGQFIFESNEAINMVTTSITLSDVTTPLPAAFPLFATGLGALGLLGWRRKRKDIIREL